MRCKKLVNGFYFLDLRLDPSLKIDFLTIEVYFLGLGVPI